MYHEELKDKPVGSSWQQFFMSCYCAQEARLLLMKKNMELAAASARKMAEKKVQVITAATPTDRNKNSQYHPLISKKSPASTKPDAFSKLASGLMGKRKHSDCKWGTVLGPSISSLNVDNYKKQRNSIGQSISLNKTKHL
jgi:hypothetical protein